MCLWLPGVTQRVNAFIDSMSSSINVHELHMKTNSECYGESLVIISTLYTEGPRPRHDEDGENVVRHLCVLLCVSKT